MFRRRSVPDTEFPASIAPSSEDAVVGVCPGAKQNEILEQRAWQIVHDMRNCLQVLSGHGEMLCQAVGENKNLRWHTDEIQKALSQAAKLASDLQVSLAPRELDRNPAKCGEACPQHDNETSSQTITSSAPPLCGNACSLLNSSSRTVFWRQLPALSGCSLLSSSSRTVFWHQLPSLSGPISLGLPNELSRGASIGGLPGIRQ